MSNCKTSMTVFMLLATFMSPASSFAQSTPAVPPKTTPAITTPAAGKAAMGHKVPLVAGVSPQKRMEKPSAAGKAEFTWLGHAAWIIRAPSGATILVDPWLTNPKAPKEFAIPEVVDAILITHGHFDHVGEAYALAKKLNAPVIGSYEVIENLGLNEHGMGINIGGMVKVKDLSIYATEAVHSSGMHPAHLIHEHDGSCSCPMHAHQNNCPCNQSGKGSCNCPANTHDVGCPCHGDPAAAGHTGTATSCPCPAPAMPGHEGGDTSMPASHPHVIYGGSAMGFIIKMERGPTIYAAGDTDVFSGMKLIAERYHPAIALLPIGGHFTMDAKGAALAGKMLGVKEILPMHYGTFPQLVGTPQQLRQAVDKTIRVVAPGPGERVTY